MREQIVLNFNSEQHIILPIFTKKNIELLFSPVGEEVTLNVIRFPKVKKVALSPQEGLIHDKITLNIIQQTLVRDVDPLIMLDQMDNETLRDLDIKDDVYITSID